MFKLTAAETSLEKNRKHEGSWVFLHYCVSNKLVLICQINKLFAILKISFLESKHICVKMMGVKVRMAQEISQIPETTKTKHSYLVISHPF